MRDWHQTVCLRALIMASLGLGLTGCIAENAMPELQQANYRPAAAAHYAPLYHAQYPAQYQTPQPYLLAQNNAVPSLRGMAPPSPQLNHSYYQNYRAETPQSQPRYMHVESAQPRPRIMGGFTHQLDDSDYTLPESSEPHYQAGPVHPQYQISQSPPTLSAPEYEPEYDYEYEPKASYHEAAQERATEVNPNSIDQSLRSAIEQSPRLAIEDLKIQEAEEGLIQAKAQGRFKLNLESVVGASQSHTDFSIVNRSNSDFRLRRAANLDLSVPIYQGGRIKAQKNVAKTGIDTAQANYDVVQSAVNQETAIAHLNVIRDRDLIQVYARNVELLKKQKQNVQAMVRAGENTVTDEALIDARLASIEVRLEQSKADLAASESNFKKLVGSAAPALMPVETVTLPSSLQDIKALAQENNAQVKAVQTQEEAAFHNIALAKSFGRPKLSLQGVLRAAEGQSDTIRRDSAAEVLLNLSVPLLSGGENKSRVRQAAMAQSRAVLESHELHNNLNERLEQLWASVQSARRSQAPNQAQKIAAQKAYAAITKQRNAGLATSLDVLSVEQTLLDAEINLLQAQNTEDVSRIQLLGLMGAL